MIRTAVAAILLGAIAAQVGMASDWPYWRGPEQNGISRETGLVDDWSFEGGKNVLWKSDVGGRAAPIIMNGRVFLNCRTADDVTDPVEKIHAREQVICWDLESGDELWRDKFNVFQTDIPAPRVGWGSMVGDTETGNVYCHSVSGIFRCYTPDGEVVWEHSLGEDVGKISGYGGRTQSPIIDEDRIIVGYLVANWGDLKGPGPAHAFYAFDKRTGEIEWISTPGGTPLDTTYTNPVIAVINGQRQLICGNADGGVYGINARTGQPIWGFRMSKRGLNASPVVDGNYVYISHGEDNIDTTDFGRIQCIDATGTGDVTETHSVWRVDGIKAGYTGLLVKDGILYVVADIGDLFAFDAKSGEQLWEHNLGTVGKGSPVWADGKLYVMEVNGSVHILKPSREGCETISRVDLSARVGSGMDEIYSSPAISDGKVVLVTRDRTICLFDKTKENKAGEIPALPDEGEADDEVALIQLRPYEVAMQNGDSASFELHSYDKLGRLISVTEPELKLSEQLGGLTAEGASISVPDSNDKHLGGTFTATVGDLTATGRARVYPPLPWKWDFTGYKMPQVPPTWVRAHIKIKPTDLEGDVAMKAGPGPGRPSHSIWMGPSTMSGYTVQCDVLLKEQTRRLPSIGVTANRYDLILKGNNQKLAIQSWAPHLRMAKEQRFRSDPDTWYTMKLTVKIEDGEAHVFGKVWERGTEEPAEWTIEATDPHPNMSGSPGLYFYSLADMYYDNVMVTQE